MIPTYSACTYCMAVDSFQANWQLEWCNKTINVMVQNLSIKKGKIGMSLCIMWNFPLIFIRSIENTLNILLFGIHQHGETLKLIYDCLLKVLDNEECVTTIIIETTYTWSVYVGMVNTMR